MPLNLQSTRQLLQDFEFRRLFVEELGWSHPPYALKPADAEAKGGLRFHRAPVAVLSGIHVFEITTPDGQIPPAKARAAIHTAVSVLAAENLLIFTDAARTQSLWYWVKREAGKSHARDHLYVKGQPGDLFLSKLAAMVVDITELDAEGNIPVTEVAHRLKAALDVERVTKKFYRDFDEQRLAFVELIEGVPDEHQRRWYASVLMNRLMFIYFLQKKFFLDGGNEHYLEDKLAASRQRGPDQFFQVFLRPLFFEGFAKPEAARSPAARALLGKIRYLNGGLFLPHRVELAHGHPDQTRIKIPDHAFANVLSLFGRYSWNLNDAPGGKDDEINPDVLGYIFEKYINQKEFGAYYTRPEMTGYLCERTIFKLVLDRVNQASVEADVRRLTSPAAQSALRTPRSAFHSISDLLLNLDAPLCRALLFDILPSLRLLDPACGSGAFLVAAMKVLIALYAAVIGKIQFLNHAELAAWLKQVQAEHPSPLYYIKKRIITENLFGVDIMEEATEIARLRLFLALVASAQTEDQLEPLPNIDFNILAGNSLIGLLHVDPKKFDAGSGAPASGPAGGQDRLTLQHDSALGFAVETKAAPTKQEKVAAYVAQRTAARFAAILEDKNRSIELYRKHAFQPDSRSRGRESAPTSKAGASTADGGTNAPTNVGGYDDLADLVDQDERVLRLREHIEKVRADAYQRMNQLLLEEFKALGIQFEQATWDDKKNDTGKPAKRPLKLADIEALQPFHWGYEFDKVLADGGFDSIITNPPWEIFKPQAKEFFDAYSDLISKNKMTIKEFEKEQAKLLKNPEIRTAWLEFRSRFPHVNLYFRNVPQFRNQLAWVDGKKATTDLNLYKLFLEHSLHLLRLGGQCGIIIPSGIYTDLGAKQLREMLFNETEITGLFGFENRKEIFENVDSRFKFVVLTYGKGGPTRRFPATFMRHEVEELDGFPALDSLPISVEMIRRLSPDSLSILEFRNERDIATAEKLHHFTPLGEPIAGKWSLQLQREFHMTDDAPLYKTTPGKGRAPLYEGKMIHQFQHGFAEPRYWLDPAEARAALLPARLKAIQRLASEGGLEARVKPDDLLLDYQSYRLAFRDVARNTDERTMIATVLPPGVFCPHTISLEVVFHDEVQPERGVHAASPSEWAAALTSPEPAGEHAAKRAEARAPEPPRLRLNVPGLTAAERLYLAAIFNSFAADYQLRQKITNHLSFFFIYQLPAPRLTATDAAFAPIVQRAAQLICTTPEFDELAREVFPLFSVAADVSRLTSPSGKELEPTHVGCYWKEIGVTAAAARAQLRAELDALVAHLYGLTEAEFTYILTTFPLVSQGVKDATLAAYRAAAPERETSARINDPSSLNPAEIRPVEETPERL